MNRHFKRVAVIGFPVLLGIMIGAACNEAARDRSAQAEAPDGKAAEAKPDGKPAEAKKVARFGSVIGLKPEKKDYYVKLHAETWPSVLNQIRQSNIQDYSIYLAELEGKLYLFSYFEYTGKDFKADMKQMAKDPETQRWWKETDPCQIRLAGTPEGEWWKRMPEVFHTD